MSDKLTIVARIEAKKESTEFVKSELEKLLSITKAEKGCLQYDLHQDNSDPSVFLYFENWESKELWLAHMENDHLKQYMEATDGHVTSFTLNEMSQIGC